MVCWDHRLPSEILTSAYVMGTPSHLLHLFVSSICTTCPGPGPCLRYVQLLLLSFRPLGSHLAKVSSPGHVTGTGKNPWRLWPVSWLVTVFTCWAARPPGLFSVSLILITEEMTKTICLPNSTGFEAIIVQMGKKKQTWISIWHYASYPTILSQK